MEIATVSYRGEFGRGQYGQLYILHPGDNPEARFELIHTRPGTIHITNGNRTQDPERCYRISVEARDMRAFVEAYRGQGRLERYQLNATPCRLEYSVATRHVAKLYCFVKDTESGLGFMEFEFNDRDLDSLMLPLYRFLQIEDDALAKAPCFGL